MKRIARTPLAMLLWRILLLYIVLLLCRTVFYFYNIEQLGTLSWSELGQLFAGSLKFDTASIIYANGLFILLSLLPLHLRERGWYRKILFWYYVVVNSLLIVMVNMADCVYFRYTQKRFTADEIFFADNSNSLQLVGKFMGENWYLVLITIVLIGILVWGYRRKVKEESLLSRGAAYYIGGTAILALAVGLCIAGVRGGMTRMTRPITLSNATLYTSDSGKANLILSNPFCILRTVGNAGTIRYKHYFAADELSQHFTPIHDRVDSTALNLSGRNVVIFIMESMSAEHSAHLMPEIYADKEQKGFTPFLDSLMRNGLNFRHMYANGTRSIQAMPAVLGSIPSFKSPFVLMPQSLGESRQLPAMLRDKGYATSFFCGSEHGSMGFGAYARSAGVDRLVSREDYEAKHGTDDFDGYWGIWDEPFLQFMGEELAETPEPFFASLFTLSSHHPFVVPTQYEDKLPNGYTKIHKGVAYDDQAFRLFFERFGNEEWFRRTIFVFVADHVSSEKFADVTRTYPGNYHIIGFMYTPDGAFRGEVNEIVQQLDIMPTVLGMLGNKEPYFAFGRDLFNEPRRPQWSVSWDGTFQAVMPGHTIRFDDTQDKGSSEANALTASSSFIAVEPSAGNQSNADSLALWSIADTTAQIELRPVPTEDPKETLQTLKALIQQYYTHIEQKSYIVK